MLSKVVVLALCVGSLLADPSCDTPGLNPELRQKILEFHKEKAKSLDWDCELEKKAHESIKYNEVDTSGIGGRVNEYAEMSIGTMEVNVKEALRYWFEKNPYYARENMENSANVKIGCTYKVDPPLIHFICAYVVPYKRKCRVSSGINTSTNMLSKVVILALCAGTLLADPKCGTPGLTPGLRQKILEFHKEAKSLQWDCGLEQKAHDAITEDGVDYNKIGGRVNEYTEMPKGMETDVEEALDYWWNKDPRDGHANMANPANVKIGCTYKNVEPLFFFVCAYA